MYSPVSLHLVSFPFPSFLQSRTRRAALAMHITGCVPCLITLCIPHSSACCAAVCRACHVFGSSSGAARSHAWYVSGSIFSAGLIPIVGSRVFSSFSNACFTAYFVFFPAPRIRAPCSVPCGLLPMTAGPSSGPVPLCPSSPVSLMPPFVPCAVPGLPSSLLTCRPRCAHHQLDCHLRPHMLHTITCSVSVRSLSAPQLGQPGPAVFIISPCPAPLSRVTRLLIARPPPPSSPAGAVRSCLPLSLACAPSPFPCSRRARAPSAFSHAAPPTSRCCSLPSTSCRCLSRRSPTPS